jgi:2-octaprenylphenol hydroxylase
VSAGDWKIAVVGGGLVGTAAAVALAHSGCTVELIDARLSASVDTDWDSRIYAISPGNAEYLDQLGVWARLDPARLQAVEAMHIEGDMPGCALRYDAYDCGFRELAFILESRNLQEALDQAAIAAGVRLRRPASVVALDTAGAVKLTLTDGECVDVDMLVGADGGDSWVRQAAGLGIAAQRYPQDGVVANFSVSLPHRGTAYQWFRDDGILALLPMPGDRVSMVWSAQCSLASELPGLPAQEICERVFTASHGVLGHLDLITAATAFPLRRALAAHSVAPRVALVGDAAHGVHPLAGQGVNLGFRDVRELMRVLATRPPRQSPGDIALLRRYERARREDIATMTFATDGLQKLFSSRQVWLRRSRNAGLGIVNALPFLKKSLVRHAVA